MDHTAPLWDQASAAAPIIFNCMNNFTGWAASRSARPWGMPVRAQLGAAVKPRADAAERVNGYIRSPVIDAFRRKKHVLLEGRGPVLLDTVTYRISGIRRRRLELPVEEGN